MRFFTLLLLAFLLSPALAASEDTQTGFASYFLLAEQGDAKAQYQIGNGYENGLGTNVDYKQAMYWYLRSAEQDNAEAEYSIASMYENGRGIDKDSKKAMDWYLKAANLGSWDAWHKLSWIYYQGILVPKDYEESAFWELLAKIRVAEVDANTHDYKGPVLIKSYPSRDHNIELTGNQLTSAVSRAQNWVRAAQKRGLTWANATLPKINDSVLLHAAQADFRSNRCVCTPMNQSPVRIDASVNQSSLYTDLYRQKGIFYIDIKIKNTSTDDQEIFRWTQQGWSWVTDAPAIKPHTEALQNVVSKVILNPGDEYKEIVEMTATPGTPRPLKFSLGFFPKAEQPISDQPNFINSHSKEIIWSYPLTLYETPTKDTIPDRFKACSKDTECVPVQGCCVHEATNIHLQPDLDKYYEERSKSSFGLPVSLPCACLGGGGETAICVDKVCLIEPPW